MVRSFCRHILYNLLAVAWYENFLLLSLNWPIIIIWLSDVPSHTYFFHRVLYIKILSFPHRARGSSVQMERSRIYLKCNCSFEVQTWLVPDEKCAIKITKIVTILDYSNRQNIIFLLNKWIEMQNPFLDMTLICSHASNGVFASILDEVDRRTEAMLHCWNYCQNHQKCYQRTE